MSKLDTSESESVFTKESNSTKLQENNNVKSEIKIIDPINCLFRLIFLPYQPQQTKLYVDKFSISYRSDNLIQPLIRWSLGESRQDIQHLQLPVMLALTILEGNRHLNCLIEHLYYGIASLLKHYPDQETQQYLQGLQKAIYKFKENPHRISHSYFIGKEKYPSQIMNLWSTTEISYLIRQLKSILLLPQIFTCSEMKNKNLSLHLSLVDNIFKEKSESISLLLNTQNNTDSSLDSSITSPDSSKN